MEKLLLLPNSMDKKLSNFEIEKAENIQFNLKKSHQKTIEEDEQTKIQFNQIPPPINLELIESKKSSDSTSYISISQNENLSQTSESSLFNSYTFNSKLIIQKDSSSINDEEKLNYFYGIESYFYKIMPDKFNDYKKTKNYLPKKRISMNLDETKEIIQKDEENKNVLENNKNYQINHERFHMGKNLNYITQENSFLYNYNTFYFNNPFLKINNNDTNQEKNIENNTNKEKEENKEDVKEEDKNKNKDNQENKKKMKIEYKNIINNDNTYNIFDDEQDVNIYIIEKIPNYKAYNNNFKEKNNKKMFIDNINKNLNYNKKYYNYKHKIYNKKYYNNIYYKNNNIPIRDSYYKLNENNHEQKNNYYNCNNYNKRKPIKIIYY